MSVEFLDCLKRERDISIKPMLSGGKTTFRVYPRLNRKKWLTLGMKRVFFFPPLPLFFCWFASQETEILKRGKPVKVASRRYTRDIVLVKRLEKSALKRSHKIFQDVLTEGYKEDGAYTSRKLKSFLFRFLCLQCTQRPNDQKATSWISCAKSLRSGIVRRLQISLKKCFADQNCSYAY